MSKLTFEAEQHLGKLWTELKLPPFAFYKWSLEYAREIYTFVSSYKFLGTEELTIMFNKYDLWSDDEKLGIKR